MFSRWFSRRPVAISLSPDIGSYKINSVLDARQNFRKYGNSSKGTSRGGGSGGPGNRTPGGQRGRRRARDVGRSGLSAAARRYRRRHFQGGRAAPARSVAAALWLELLAASRSADAAAVGAARAFNGAARFLGRAAVA